MNHAGYRLLQSACYKESKGKLALTSCHDPHTAKAQLVRRLPWGGWASREVSEDCAGCHMVKQPANDAIHVRDRQITGFG